MRNKEIDVLLYFSVLFIKRVKNKIYQDDYVIKDKLLLKLVPT